MISTKRLYDAVQLAEASFTLLDMGIVPAGDDLALRDALNDPSRQGEFSATQAAAFVDSWSLVSHQPDTASGFSATLFKQKGSASDYVLAIRGTEFTREPILDLGRTDLGQIVLDGVAANQIIDLYDYWKELTAGAGATVRLARLVSTLDPNASGIFATVPIIGATQPPFESYRR